MEDVAAIILAAGKGTRIQASKDCNKVAYPLGAKPMVSYTVDHLLESGITQIIAVVGFAAQSVRHALGTQVTYVEQRQRLGTGHAVKTGLRALSPKIKTILTMYGDDSAFYPPSLFREVVSSHLSHHASVSVVTIIVSNPSGLGRIIRNQSREMVGIIEEKVATPAQKQITEINTGLFCFNHQFLKTGVSKLHKNPLSGEYYLTDIVAHCLKTGGILNPILWPDNHIWHGVNTREELALVNKFMVI